MRSAVLWLVSLLTLVQAQPPPSLNSLQAQLEALKAQLPPTCNGSSFLQRNATGWTCVTPIRGMDNGGWCRASLDGSHFVTCDESASPLGGSPPECKPPGGKWLGYNATLGGWVCVCNSGWSGTSCDISNGYLATCSSPPVCFSDGWTGLYRFVDGVMICDCLPNWSGVNCSMQGSSSMELTTITQFTTPGTSVFSAAFTAFAELLIVGGGGCGGAYVGGGGGGGGVVHLNMILLQQGNYTITVGHGAPGGSSPGGSSQNGGNSSFGNSSWTATALGGGYGAEGGQHTTSTWPSTIAGCGGGGGSSPGAESGSNGTSGQGLNGGSSYFGGNFASGGGGGASGSGQSVNASSLLGGAGGNGYACNITGNLSYYGGGGGGAVSDNQGGVGPGGIGGLGGGGKGAFYHLTGDVVLHGTGGAENSGGGGGGGGINNFYQGQGYAGGSGIVILRYPIGPLGLNPPNPVPSPSPRNLTGLTATQSATWGSASASYAVDGNTAKYVGAWRANVSPNCDNDNVIAISLPVNGVAWLMVDLQTVHAVQTVFVYGRNPYYYTNSSCLADPANGYNCQSGGLTLAVGNSSTTGGMGNPVCAYRFDATIDGNAVVCNMVGRYVTIFKSITQNVMSVCQVVVQATSSPSPSPPPPSPSLPSPSPMPPLPPLAVGSATVCTSQYILIDDPGRDYQASGGCRDDSGLAQGWYRFKENGLDAKIPEYPAVPEAWQTGGTERSSRLLNPNPSISDGIVSATITFPWGNGVRVGIQIVNCGSFYLYYLSPFSSPTYGGLGGCDGVPCGYVVQLV